MQFLTFIFTKRCKKQVRKSFFLPSLLIFIINTLIINMFLLQLAKIVELKVTQKIGPNPFNK